MPSVDYLAAIDAARQRLDRDHPRVHLTLRARLHRRLFGVWPAAVAAQSWNRAQHFKRLLAEEIRERQQHPKPPYGENRV